jgi:alkylation response protein AidB-like acyl-CoA dehydrogenase
MPLWRDHEESDFLDQIRGFVAEHVRPIADDLDKKDLYPAEVVAKAAAEGFNSLYISREYGGEGAKFNKVVALFEEIGVASASVAISLISNFQAQNIIQRSGSTALKENYLPKFRQGLTSSYALTERSHGSDIRSLDTKAELHGDHWVLTGQKSFITSGTGAQLFVILAQTSEGVSVFAVPRSAENVSTYASDQSETIGLRNGPHVELVLNGVRIPRDHLIGEEGKGLKSVLTNLNYSRILNAAVAIGIARAAFDESLKFVKSRKAFDQFVFDFQGIQWYFAEMLTDIDSARLMLYCAAEAIDKEIDIDRFSSEAKLKCCAVANRVANQAIQVCGAYGTMTNSPFGRYARDAKTFEIGGGSVEVLKNTLGRYLKRL